MRFIRKYQLGFTVAFLTLSCGLFVFYFVHLELEKIGVRHQVQVNILKGLDHSELVYIQIPENELDLLEWEHESEFKFKGQFYDVVEVVSTTDSSGYWCWMDTEESELEEEIEKLIALATGNHPSDQDRQASFNRFITSLFYAPLSSKLVTFEELTKAQTYSLKILQLKKLDNPPPFPPPEFC